MRRLVSGCAALSLAVGTLSVGWTLGMGGAQAAPSTRTDFNRDGFADLAVSALDHGGVVHVIYGSANGLTARRNQYWSQNSPGIIGTAESGDRFGSAVAAGDFDGDGFTDLAVGAPGENQSRGLVHVIYGSPSGLTAHRNRGWTQDSAGIYGTAEYANNFGSTLAAANFGKSGQADLAVGTPGENGSRGAVNVIYGSTHGLTATGNQIWTQDSPGIYGTARTGEGFGSSLAAANFGKSGYADLAIGVPRDNEYPTNLGSGAVNVIYGSTRGLTATGNQYWTQDSAGIYGTAEDGEQFGSALAAANFGKSGYADLAVGAPNHNDGRGELNVIYGSANGLTAARTQYWTQDSAGIFGTAEIGDFFGAAMAAGDFNRDGFADLAVAARDEDDYRGAVNVIYGSAVGLTEGRDQYWTQDSSGIFGYSAAWDRFGGALASGDFDGDGFADLAVGARGNNANRGSVNVIYGSTRRLTATGNQYWTEDSPGILGTAASNHYFGSL